MSVKFAKREELIKAYIEFFKSKNHKEMPSASLIPENDPTVLFTTAGMHPLVPYLLGEKHPLGKRLVDVQKCLRTGDIDAVGDSFHHTFFEMMGNWSLGDYFNKEAIEWSFELATRVLRLDKKRLAVSVFAGDRDASRDENSAKVWESLGISKDRIVFLPKESNWWEHPSNNTPCGPCTEVFYWKDKKKKVPKKFNPDDENWVEIWNDVLMGYTKVAPGKYVMAKQRNVDNGRGLERVLAVVNGYDDNYLTDVWQPIIKEIEKISQKKYKGNEKPMRIIADHIKAATFILGDEKGIKPSNVGQGYVLRRLIRRAIRYGKMLGIENNFCSGVVRAVIPIYPDYLELKRNEKFIISQIDEEEKRFLETINQGMKEFEKLTKDLKKLSGKDAFLLFQSFGFPIEMTQELAKENKIKIDIKEYEEEQKKHQELSRTASAGTFKSGLADSTEQTKKLHTATHLLNAALKAVLKDKGIKQKGSNINAERLRFDFNLPRKLEDKEIKAIEEWVNDKIKQSIEVKKEEMKVKDALATGAEGVFGAKYPEVVSVYTIEDKKDKKGFFSKEICTGPHVSNTSELGKFKIIKEEAVAAGIRRIKATLS